MARAIDADELEMFPYSEGAGTEEQIADWIEQVGISEDDTASRARDLCWKVIGGFINVVKTQPTLTPPNEPLTLEQLREMDGEPVWVVDQPSIAGNGATGKAGLPTHARTNRNATLKTSMGCGLPTDARRREKNETIFGIP